MKELEYVMRVINKIFLFFFCEILKFGNEIINNILVQDNMNNIIYNVQGSGLSVKEGG